MQAGLWVWNPGSECEFLLVYLTHVLETPEQLSFENMARQILHDYRCCMDRSTNTFYILWTGLICLYLVVTQTRPSRGYSKQRRHLKCWRCTFRSRLTLCIITSKTKQPKHRWIYRGIESTNDSESFQLLSTWRWVILHASCVYYLACSF